jgi:hypothetical protein
LACTWELCPHRRQNPSKCLLHSGKICFPSGDRYGLLGSHGLTKWNFFPFFFCLPGVWTSDPEAVVGFGFTKPDFLEVFEETMAAGWGNWTVFEGIPFYPFHPPKG